MNEDPTRNAPFRRLANPQAAAWAVSLALAALTIGRPTLLFAQPAVSDSTVVDSTVAPIPMPPTMTPPSERLPFAGNEAPLRVIGFGAGMALYAGSLGDVERAFTKLEDVYRAQGYSLPRTKLHLDRIRSCRLTLRPARNYEVIGQVGRSHGTGYEIETELNQTGLLVVRRFAASPGGGYALTAGLGGGGYGFSFTHRYDVPVSPQNSDGSFYLLRRITLEGSGAYGTAAAGITLRAGRYIALDALGQYLLAKDVTAEAQPAGRVTMNLSGLLFGAALTFFY